MCRFREDQCCCQHVNRDLPHEPGYVTTNYILPSYGCSNLTHEAYNINLSHYSQSGEASPIGSESTHQLQEPDIAYFNGYAPPTQSFYTSTEKLHDSPSLSPYPGAFTNNARSHGLSVGSIKQSHLGNEAIQSSIAKPGQSIEPGLGWSGLGNPDAQRSLNITHPSSINLALMKSSQAFPPSGCDLSEYANNLKQDQSQQNNFVASVNEGVQVAPEDNSRINQADIVLRVPRPSDTSEAHYLFVNRAPSQYSSSYSNHNSQIQEPFTVVATNQQPADLDNQNQYSPSGAISDTRQFPYKCPYEKCKSKDKKIFTGYSDWQAHWYRAHEKRFSCSMCNAIFGTDAEVRRHSTAIHPNGPKEFTCKVRRCAGRSQEFNRKHRLKEHMEKWHGYYYCSAMYCSRGPGHGFKHQTLLNEHLIKSHGHGGFSKTVQDAEKLFISSYLSAIPHLWPSKEPPIEIKSRRFCLEDYLESHTAMTRRNFDQSNCDNSGHESASHRTYSTYSSAYSDGQCPNSAKVPRSCFDNDVHGNVVLRDFTSSLPDLIELDCAYSNRGIAQIFPNEEWFPNAPNLPSSSADCEFSVSNFTCDPTIQSSFVPTICDSQIFEDFDFDDSWLAGDISSPSLPYDEQFQFCSQTSSCKNLSNISTGAGTSVQGSKYAEFLESNFCGPAQCPWVECTSRATFATLKAFSKHLKNIHLRPLVCDHDGCGYQKPFRNKYDLERHRQTAHVRARNHECPFLHCGNIGFARKDKLWVHIRECHDKPSTVSTCPVIHCGKEVKTPVSEHIQKEHGSFECGLSTCGTKQSRFTDIQLESHLRSAHGLNFGEASKAVGAAKKASDKTIRIRELYTKSEIRECAICSP
ncbi:putative transcription factor c2h2 protein [Botrytis fragariae]|uniref:Putative transcription factor c2h2 protein n=1 Tax=Botrytis fragariae TaxID=1964551 RepID=A0A8H6AI71_9HELO|nr:putative transcription factor c2h2 protein [Botrytis fragariae]KAF5867688.1 putative transcription factor c2h2 protein [Botrytis fragariae]